MASSQVKTLFFEDVTHWLDFSNVRYISRVKFTGKSGFDHMFDFVIPKSKQAPERLVQALNNPNKEAAQVAVFKWLDTREIRPADSQLITLLNDATKPISPIVLEAFHNYDLQTILWSEREKSRELFVA